MPSLDPPRHSEAWRRLAVHLLVGHEIDNYVYAGVSERWDSVAFRAFIGDGEAALS